MAALVEIWGLQNVQGLEKAFLEKPVDLDFRTAL